MGRAVQWSRLRDTVLDLLFPPKCVGCGAGGQLLCDDCLSSAARIRPPICPRCGRPVRAKQLCTVCQEMRPVIDGIRSVAYFEGVLRRAIHRFKYNGLQALAGPLARLLVEYQMEHQLPADVIVPVPLHPDREAERGYNQAGLLAEALGAKVECPVVQTGLSRVRPTAPQIEFNARERHVNVADAFRARKEAIVAQRILLIDDVCTTGATMEACAEALKAAGARSVWGLALARGR